MEFLFKKIVNKTEFLLEVDILQKCWSGFLATQSLKKGYNVFFASKSTDICPNKLKLWVKLLVILIS